MTTHVESYENEVVREQLDYLIEHTGVHVPRGCPECQHYLRVRSALLEIFGDVKAAGRLIPGRGKGGRLVRWPR